MKKVLSILLIVLLFSLVLVGCGKEAVEEDVQDPPARPVINIATLKGPTGMGMVKLMELDEKGETKVDYNFQVVGSPTQVVSGFVNGEIDIAAMPTNLAAILHAKTEGNIQLLAVNTLGVLFVLEKGTQIETIKDLAGKKIGSAGQGAVPEFLLQFLLQENNLDSVHDVEIDFYFEHSALATKMIVGEIDYALLPQPFVTSVMMQNKDVRIALDFTKEWEKVLGEGKMLPMGVVAARKDFVAENREAVIAFLSEYKESIAFVNNNVEEASVLIEKHGILPKAQIAKLAIPYSSIVYFTAQDAKADILDFFKVIYDFDPKSIGGSLPSDEFFFE